MARQITDLGESIGLAPPKPGSDATTADSVPPPPSAGDEVVPGPPPGRAADSGALEAGEDAELDDESGDELDAEPLPLPIARYDELTAKEIIGLLGELDEGQLDRIRAHEQSNRARKTVLGKLDRLAG